MLHQLLSMLDGRPLPIKYDLQVSFKRKAKPVSLVKVCKANQ